MGAVLFFLFHLSAEEILWLGDTPAVMEHMDTAGFITCLLPFSSAVNKGRVSPQRCLVSMQRCHLATSESSSPLPPTREAQPTSCCGLMVTGKLVNARPFCLLKSTQ